MDSAPDALGDGWLAHRIPLQPDPVYGPDPCAVLVHRPSAVPRRRAVLYLHGFTDYFFQARHAQRWEEAGTSFYALDLRLAGRAIEGHPRPGDVRDLRDHDEEIAAALDAVRAAGHEQVVLLGHSTGGLIACSWAARHPGSVDAVVLNSPWLDHNGPWHERALLTPAVRLLARWLPSAVVGRLDAGYGRSLHASTGGAWHYDLAWKPIEGFRVRAAFFSSVRCAHAEVARGLGITVPVLLCCSSCSGSPSSPSDEELAGCDCVLDVAQMVERAPLLGDDVTVVQVDGGIHDLALSAPGPREAYEGAVLDWVAQRLPD